MLFLRLESRIQRRRGNHGNCPRPHRRLWPARGDLREWRRSRVVAQEAEGAGDHVKQKQLAIRRASSLRQPIDYESAWKGADIVPNVGEVGVKLEARAAFFLLLDPIHEAVKQAVRVQ
jgi:hypothetical protein